MVDLTSRICVAANAAGVEESEFFGRMEGPLDPHRIGWIIAGSCTVVVSIFSQQHGGRRADREQDRPL